MCLFSYQNWKKFSGEPFSFVASIVDNVVRGLPLRVKIQDFTYTSSFVCTVAAAITGSLLKWNPGGTTSSSISISGGFSLSEFVIELNAYRRKFRNIPDSFLPCLGLSFLKIVSAWWLKTVSLSLPNFDLKTKNDFSNFPLKTDVWMKPQNIRLKVKVCVRKKQKNGIFWELT